MGTAKCSDEFLNIFVIRSNSVVFHSFCRLRDSKLMDFEVSMDLSNELCSLTCPMLFGRSHHLYFPSNGDETIIRY